MYPEPSTFTYLVRISFVSLASGNLELPRSPHMTQQAAHGGSPHTRLGLCSSRATHSPSISRSCSLAIRGAMAPRARPSARDTPSRRHTSFITAHAVQGLCCPMIFQSLALLMWGPIKSVTAPVSIGGGSLRRWTCFGATIHGMHSLSSMGLAGIAAGCSCTCPFPDTPGLRAGAWVRYPGPICCWGYHGSWVPQLWAGPGSSCHVLTNRCGCGCK